MSARGPIGASSRPELFTSRATLGVESKAAEAKESEAENIIEEGLNERYGITAFGDNSPLQLEHMIGFAGDNRQTVLMSPTNENIFVRRYVQLDV